MESIVVMGPLEEVGAAVDQDFQLGVKERRNFRVSHSYIFLAFNRNSLKGHK